MSEETRKEQSKKLTFLLLNCKITLNQIINEINDYGVRMVERVIVQTMLKGKIFISVFQ